MIRLLSSLHARHVVCSVLALLCSMPYGWRAVFSLAVGGGIQIVNLVALERSVASLVALASASRGGAGQVLLATRYLALVAAVGVALWKLPIDPLFFAVGLSALVPAVIWHGLAASPSGRSA